MLKRLMTAAGAAALLAACGGEEQGGDTALETPAEAPVTEETAADETMAAGADDISAEAVGRSEGEVVRWVVRDEDSTMVLFPTIHILPDGLDWRSEDLNATLAEADEVWFELEPAEMMNQAKAQELSMQYGMDQETPLSEKLDEETYAEFTRVAEGLGLPPANLEPMRPWLAAVTLQVMDLMQAGYNPAAGAEMVLAEDVPDEKERGLETLEQQMAFFGNLPQDVEVAFLRSTLDEIDEGQEQIKQFAEDWAEGDISALQNELIDQFRDQSEELYQILLVQRNEVWVDQLRQELDGSGNDFVAVGALHLVGEDGVPAMLADMGYEVEGPLPR